jgi:hypothetical protein
MREALGFMLVFFLFVGFPLFVIVSLLCVHISATRDERFKKKNRPVQMRPAANPNPIIPTTPHVDSSVLVAKSVRVASTRDEQPTPAVPSHVPSAGWNLTHSIGPTREEVADKSAKGQLIGSDLEKDMLKSRTKIQQNVLKMIQQGGSVEEIEKRLGVTPEEIQRINAEAYKELSEKIAPMVASGMTMEDIIEKLRPHAEISPTDSPGLTPTRMWIPQAVEDQQPPAEKTAKPPRRGVHKSSEASSQSIPDPSPAPEGGRKPKTNYAVVRSAKLRKSAIQIHGRNCSACGFNFDETFGEILSQGYIEIHHLNSIASGVRNTDPATDLAPLCGNCHAMADRLTRHHASPPRSLGELRKLLFPASSLPDVKKFPDAEVPQSPVKIKIGKIREKKPKK